jgi:hypothetical protein
MCESEDNEVGSAAMLLRLSQPDLVDDLCENFRRAGFDAHSAGGSMAEVQRLGPPGEGQARREIDMLLRVWLAMRPEAGVEILD